MIEKAGADGVVEFWQRVGDNLAGRMGKEAYLGWTSFNVAVREARTAFSIEGEVTPLTDMAITDVDGDVVGYLYAMRQCCYVPTIFRTRYAARGGPLRWPRIRDSRRATRSSRSRPICSSRRSPPRSALPG